MTNKPKAKKAQTRSDKSTLVVKTPFSDNLFIVDEAHKHKFVNVAKAGVTSIKRVVAHHNGVKFKDAYELQMLLGTRADGALNVKIDQNMFADDYVRVAVFRDPVERFISWYKDKILEPKQPHVLTNGLAIQHDEERLLEFLRFELGKDDPEWIDEHIRPQARYYSLDDIDKIVMIDDLTDYLRSLGATVNEASAQNLTPSSKKVEFSAWFLKKLRKIYAEDYRLIKDGRAKIWQP